MSYTRYFFFSFLKKFESSNITKLCILLTHSIELLLVIPKIKLLSFLNSSNVLFFNGNFVYYFDEHQSSKLIKY